MSKTMHPRVSEILVSRICHDLISPVGAISNGLELIEEMGLEDGADAVDLIANSAKTAAARLSIVRYAYGAAGADAGLKASDFAKAFSDWIASSRVKMDWADLQDADMVDYPRGFLKCVLNVMKLGFECLGSGGTVTVEISEKDPLVVSVAATGDKAHFHDGCEDALNHKLPVEELEPRTVHAHVTRIFAEQYGFNLAYSRQGEGTLLFTLSV